jgi:RNA-binding protein YlmH
MGQKNEHLYMHFRQDERQMVERSLDWVRRAADRDQLVVTPFLDPREQYILQTVARREPELVFFVDGGYPDAERRRAVVAPSYVAEDPGLFGLAFFRIETLGGGLEHPDVLGALLGLGIKREKIGDILPHGSGADVVVAEEIGEFIRLHVGQVGREHVTIKKISREELTLPEQRLAIRTVNVASMRVDAIVSEGFRLSRSKAALLIRNGRCKVNWVVVDKPDHLISEGDLISLRGFGRVRVESVDGTTRKGRTWVKLASFL